MWDARIMRKTVGTFQALAVVSTGYMDGSVTGSRPSLPLEREILPDLCAGVEACAVVLGLVGSARTTPGIEAMEVDRMSEGCL
jgi:hypothetical protein